ncbi:MULTISPECIES: HNH endonuclease [Pectobacterium]|uniref:HNH endonuclease n=1 Tax=Pectobacterium TaxID=122277 RepID=UPI001B3A0ED9|nr:MULTISPECIES: HNH endonuclease signature motif containing protein [Pectobacterium]GKX39554.1 HNH endonuclease [Pectobacterium carotovorum subsp. carotovorum]MBQ4781932.1 HNH endonuclease [Pectobacterium versatile]MBQ4786392.1 HNH endonuclease [Pectobacterium versatile]MCL6324011.1 HNH endonuclease [Pectobacterium polaris]UFT92845.1 HNH endonuclease [Pectobacterium carotovorum]
MKLSKKQREKLRMKFAGRCAYCGCELPEKGWHADHVEAVHRKLEIDEEARAKGRWKLKQTGESFRPENDTLENMFPACAPCNLFKSVFDLEEFRRQIAFQTGRALKSSVNFRTAERFGQVQITPSPIVFWFEKYQTEGAA